MESWNIQKKEYTTVYFLKLIESLETSEKPDLQVLDEYFRTGEQYFLQKVKRGGEDYELWYQTAREFQRLASGNNFQERVSYCIGQQKMHLKSVELYKEKGKKELMLQKCIIANNWLNLAGACQRAGRLNSRRKN